MKSFDLGPGIRCNLDALVDTRLLIQANSGGGKSRTIRRILEQTHGQVQQLVIDPEGEFATLREKYDYVLAARNHGDTVADPRSAKLLAERLLELGVSAILDIYELKAHERIRFVRYFLEALVDAPKNLWHPALVVVDEVHVYCPQAGEAESAAAVIDLATRGRKRGFCAVLATQRLSKLHKDAAAECNNKLIGRTGLDVDMKRAADELGLAGREQMHELRTLEPGDFFAFGPALSPTVKRVHVGDVQTSHPKAGARLAFTPPPPTAKVKALLPKLADLPAEAEERSKSLQDLQRDNANLKRELTIAKKTHPAPAKTEKVDTRPYERRITDLVGALELAMKYIVEINAQDLVKAVGDSVNQDELTKAIGAAVERALKLVDQGVSAQRARGDKLRREAEQLLKKLNALLGQKTVKVLLHVRNPAAVTPFAPVQRSAYRADGALADGLTRPQQRILDALAWFEVVGLPAPEKAPLASMADASSRSSSYGNNVSALRTAGLVDYPQPGLVSLTEKGRSLASPPDVPSTVEALQAAIFAKVTNPQASILRALIQVYPDALTKDDLAEASGVSAASSSYGNNVSAMRSLGLIDYPSPGKVVARPVLFLEEARR